MLKGLRCRAQPLPPALRNPTPGDRAGVSSGEGSSAPGRLRAIWTGSFGPPGKCYRFPRWSTPPRTRGLGSGRGRTEREAAQEGDRVQCTGRAAEESARIAEEVRGALAQTQRSPDVVEAQKAAACKRQAPAALRVVHGARRSAPGGAAALLRSGFCGSDPQEPPESKPSSGDVRRGPAQLGPCK